MVFLCTFNDGDWSPLGVTWLQLQDSGWTSVPAHHLGCVLYSREQPAQPFMVALLLNMTTLEKRKLKLTEVKYLHKTS